MVTRNRDSEVERKSLRKEGEATCRFLADSQ